MNCKIFTKNSKIFQKTIAKFLKIYYNANCKKFTI